MGITFFFSFFVILSGVGLRILYVYEPVLLKRKKFVKMSSSHPAYQYLKNITLSRYVCYP